jgi:hypothetical protein
MALDNDDGDLIVPFVLLAVTLILGFSTRTYFFRVRKVLLSTLPLPDLSNEGHSTIQHHVATSNPIMSHVDRENEQPHGDDSDIKNTFRESCVELK